MAGGTERLPARIDIKRQPALAAFRPVKEADLAPAGRAQAVWLGHRAAAGDAQRREEQIQQYPASATAHLRQGGRLG